MRTFAGVACGLVPALVTAGCISGERPASNARGGPAADGVTTTVRASLTTPGTWTAMQTAAPTSPSALRLMTDGTVLLNDGSTTWYKLTPDQFGNYAAGGWSSVASSNVAKRFGPSAILKDGRFLFAGGEYASDMATVEIYNPANNTWFQGPDMNENIGDTAASILPDGRFYSGSWHSSNTYIYDPNALVNPWAFAGTNYSGGNGAETSWTLLQDGTVLAGDSRYDPAVGWSPTLPLGQFFGGDTATLLLHSGKAVSFGKSDAVGVPFIYDPATNTWTAGASAPDGLDFDDTVAATIPNGHVLCSTTATADGGPVTAMWEYDPYAAIGPDSFTKVADGTSTFANSPLPLFTPYLLQLPNGQILVAQTLQPDTPSFYIYTPAGAPSYDWRPIIGNVTGPVAGDYTMGGIQLNGLTMGASAGDDNSMATAFPLVWLADSTGRVTYCRTHDFHDMAPRYNSYGGLMFTCPDSVSNGDYTLHLSASGVEAVNTLPFTISDRTLTLVGPARPAYPGFHTMLHVKAPAGATINLTSTNPSVATVAASVTVPANGSVNTDITTLAYGKTMFVGTNPAGGNVAKQPYGWAVASVSGPVLPVSGSTATWTVTLDNLAPNTGAGVVVNLQSSNPTAATVPATVNVPSNTSSVTFPVTMANASAGPTAITASLIGSSLMGQFGYKVQSIAGPPVPQNGGTTAHWTVTISAPAPAGGLTVSLQSANPAGATVPSTVTVPAGASSAGFDVTLVDPAVAPFNITASLGVSARVRSFGYIVVAHFVTPVPILLYDLGTGTVTLNGPAPAGGLLIRLENIVQNIASVPASFTIPAGATSGGYPVSADNPGVDSIHAHVGTASPYLPADVHVALQ